MLCCAVLTAVLAYVQVLGVACTNPGAADTQRGVGPLLLTLAASRTEVQVLRQADTSSSLVTLLVHSCDPALASSPPPPASPPALPDAPSPPYTPPLPPAPSVPPAPLVPALVTTPLTLELFGFQFMPYLLRCGTCSCSYVVPGHVVMWYLLLQLCGTCSYVVPYMCGTAMYGSTRRRLVGGWWVVVCQYAKGFFC